MNSLLVLPEEFVSENRAIISGERARYVYQWHDIEAGCEQRVLLYRKALGRGTVLRADPQEIEISLESSGELPPTRLPLSLFIATPRPQTVKKVVETATSLGVSSISFIRSERVVKSYLSSKVLQPEQVRTHIFRGMEQACDPIPPEFHVYDINLAAFYRTHVLDQGEASQFSVVADTSASLDFTLRKAAQSMTFSPPLNLFIGPEAGWSEQEISFLGANGVVPVSLGSRMLRVETALAVACGELRGLL